MKIQRVMLLAICLLIVDVYTVKAQDMPDWANKLPVEKGFVFGVGNAESSDITMAKQRAIMNAKMDLVNHYNKKFEIFETKCDTLFGQDGSIYSIVTLIRSQKQAVLDGVIIANEKILKSNRGDFVYYILLKIDINKQIKQLKNEIEENSDLNKKIKDKGLIEELDGM